jgi:VWFA-related protein
MTPRALLSGGVAALLLAIGGARSVAQDQAPQPAPTFRTTVDVVRVEASVLDKDRRPVRGLTAQDFVVFENGRERPVVAFAPIELPTPMVDAAAASWVKDAPLDIVHNDVAEAGRLVIIAFDWSIRFFDQQLARRIALAAVDRLGPTDQAAVVFTKPVASAGAWQGFTSDRARLRAAIERPMAGALTDPHPDRSKRIVDPEGYSSGECLCGLCTLETLTHLGRTLRSVSQRPKVVLFIGTYVRSFEAMRPTAIPPVIPGRITPTFSDMPGTGGCGRRLRDARRDFERAMGDANVTVHVLDPVGLDTDDSTPLGPGRVRERLDTLPVIADLTGGRTVSNTSTPDDQVSAVLDETSAYYVLGFTPAAGKDSGTRTVDVRTRSRDFRVRARTHYDPSDRLGTAKKPPLERGVTDVLPARELTMTLAAAPMIAGSRPAAMLVGRVTGDGARPSAMLVAAFTPRGAPVVSRRIAMSPDAAGRTPVGLISALPLEPGSYEIRVAIERSGVAGSIHTFVDVPDFRKAPLSMSGVLLHAMPEEPMVPADELKSALSFVPTASRSFTRDGVLSAVVQVSQGTTRTNAVEPAAVRLRVRDVRDAVVRDQTGQLLPAEFMPNRTATAKLPVPLQQLQPGAYLLTIEATVGEHRAERSLRFDIR